MWMEIALHSKSHNCLFLFFNWPMNEFVASEHLLEKNHFNKKILIWTIFHEKNFFFSQRNFQQEKDKMDEGDKVRIGQSLEHGLLCIFFVCSAPSFEKLEWKLHRRVLIITDQVHKFSHNWIDMIFYLFSWSKMNFLHMNLSVFFFLRFRYLIVLL